MMKRWMLPAILMGATALAWAVPEAAADTPQPLPTQVLDPKWRAFLHLTTLQAQALPEAFRLTGKVDYDAEQTQHVAAPVSGRVTQVYVDMGHQVAAGAPLLAVSAAEAASLQAEGKRARQALEVARRAWTRTRQLLVDGAVSQKDAAQTEAELHMAEAENQRALAHLRGLGLNADAAGTRVVLPARRAGTVVQRQVHVGQEVRADSGEVLLTLSNLDTVWVLADLYEQDLARVQMGDSVQVRVAAYPHAVFPGEVVYIGDVLDPQTRTLKVRCRVPNPQRRLKPEMFATVALAHADKMGLVVPTTAVVREGPQLFVLVVQADGQTVQQRPVRLGPAHGGQQQVLGGLQAGETIVSDGALFVHHALRQG